tara:strand:- start:3131 stop:3952 length:822 start_codon:yes stop_codon:yes gene_type:complete
MNFLALALIPFSHPFWASFPAPVNPEEYEISSVASYASIENGIYMDGEVFSVFDSISFEHGGFDFSTDIYYLGGGFMDSSIDSWHNFWGLPLGDRPSMPKNEVLMRFEDNGSVLWEVNHSGFGVNPLRVSKKIGDGLDFKAVVFSGFGPLDLYSDPSFSIYKKYKHDNWFGEYGLGWFGGLDIAGVKGTAFFSFSAFRQKKVQETIFNFGIMSSTNLWEGPTNDTLEGQITEAYVSTSFKIKDYFFRIGFSEDLSVNRLADFNLFIDFFPVVK